MLRPLAVPLLLLTLLCPSSGAAQRPLSAPAVASWARTTGVLAGAALLDAPVRALVSETRSPALDVFARGGNILGTGRVLLPGMALSYGAARLLGSERGSDALLHVAASYAFGNVVVAVLKPVVGRERPHVAGEPGRFHPFSAAGADHSFPSAHAVHAFSIAAALAEEFEQPWVRGLGYGTATLVGWSRVYEDQHWLSDVAAAAAVGMLGARLTGRWVGGQPKDGEMRAVELLMLPYAEGYLLLARLPL